MRYLTCCLLALLLAPGVGQAAEAEPRFGVKPDLKTYPQAAPREALASALKAVDDSRVDYLLAHLAEPDWVTRRVELAGGAFRDVVEETTRWLTPPTLKQLRKFLAEAEWEESGGVAVGRLKGVKDREVRLKKNGERWFLEHDYRPR